MKFGIVVDSSSDLYSSDYQSDLYDFSVVPLTIILDQENYIDNDQIDMAHFIETMKNCEGDMKTSCPAPAEFMNAYQKSDKVFCFTITSGLSGTYNSAVLGKKLMLEENQNKEVAVFDTLSTAGSLILLVEKTISLIEKGLEYDEIVKELTEYNKTMQLVFTLGSFKMLINTGRMKNVVGAIANTLNIKLVAIADKEGKIEIIEKVRGSKKVYQAMVNRIKSEKDISELVIYIDHCCNIEGANAVKDLILAESSSAKVIIKECKGLTSFYAQPGGIIVSY